MRVSPLPANGIPGTSISTGHTASADKMAIAKALAAGQEKPQGLDSGLAMETREERERPDTKRIKMRTNYTTSRDDLGQFTAAEPEVTQSDVVDTATEETKPLSPQLAAIARQRRALQVKERELADREKALTAQAPQASGDLMARLKSQPLSVLQEAGVTYDQLTEAILASSQSGPDSNQIKEELLKTFDEKLNKTLQDRDALTEQQVLRDMKREADSLAQAGEDFALVRKTGSTDDVVDLIHRTYKKSGEVLGVREAMQLVEEQLLAEAMDVVGLEKVKSRLQPSLPPAQPQQRMRTLTSRDGVQSPLSPRQRALAAFHGTLKK